jgi:hypothetical protein
MTSLNSWHLPQGYSIFDNLKGQFIVKLTSWVSIKRLNIWRALNGRLKLLLSERCSEFGELFDLLKLLLYDDCLPLVLFEVQLLVITGRVDAVALLLKVREIPVPQLFVITTSDSIGAGLCAVLGAVIEPGDQDLAARIPWLIGGLYELEAIIWALQPILIQIPD